MDLNFKGLLLITKVSKIGGFGHLCAVEQSVDTTLTHCHLYKVVMLNRTHPADMEQHFHSLGVKLCLGM